MVGCQPKGDLILDVDLKPIINYLIDAYYEFMILKSGRDESFRLENKLKVSVFSNIFSSLGCPDFMMLVINCDIPTEGGRRCHRVPLIRLIKIR